MRKQTEFLVVAALFAAFTLISNLQAQPLVNIDTVTVGDAGNAADTTGYGAVADVFAIGKYEVTIGQYNTFLNTVASVTSDSYIVNLWSASMTSDLNIAGISRSGSGSLASPYSYSVIGSGNRPISYVSWFDAARFANWVNNGAINGASTETGAYTLNGATSGTFLRNPSAIWFLPNEDEWVKSAYYKSGGTNAGYWRFPTASDTAPGNSIGGLPNQANARTNGYFAVTQATNRVSDLNYLTDAGAFSNSAGPYGAFDQAGNAGEWTEGITPSTTRILRGGFWGNNTDLSESSTFSTGWPYDADQSTGFRVATVPEPSTYALLLMTAAGALWFTRKRRPIKVRALIPVVAVLFTAFAAPNLHAQLIEARAYWRGGGSVPGFLDGGGVAFDADGNLFRTQINQDLTVREGLILKITPDGAYTSIPFPYFQPYTLALTDTGNIYVGSWFNEVAKIAPDGSVTRMYTQGSAMGMAADANGNVWVGSTGGIFRISPNDDIEVFGSFFIDGANGMAVDEDGWLYFQTSVSYPGGGFAAWPDLTLTPTTVVTGTDYLGNQQGFTFRGSVSPHPLVPNANSGDVGQRAFYTVPEPSTYALLLMTAAGALWFARRRR